MKNQENINWWNSLDHRAIMQRLIDKIVQFRLEEHVELIQASSREAPSIEGIDLLHIDGNHSEESSFLDVTKWVPCVKEGGWIVLDDVDWIEEGVYTQKKTIDYLDEHCSRIEIAPGDAHSWGIWKKQ